MEVGKKELRRHAYAYAIAHASMPEKVVYDVAATGH